MAEKHNHHHTENLKGANSVSGRLFITLVLNLLITVAELIGGIISGSLSLISDALHNFSDAVSIIISYIAIKLKRKTHSPKHTFGLKRAEILAAAFNAGTLIVISAYLFYEAVLRLVFPEPVNAGLMIIVASFGFAANVAGTALLRRDSGRSMNIRSSYLHLLSDAVSSAAVIAGGIAIYYWQIFWLDPILTILIGVYIIRESYLIVSDTIHVLMEGAPSEVSINEIRNIVEAYDDIIDIHHVHIWSVGENDIHLEAHLNVKDMLISRADRLRTEIEKALAEKLRINHITLQFESNCCDDTDLLAHNKKARA